MSEAGHTPGPWRDGQAGNLRVYGPDGMGEHSGLIAEVFKSRANARLIAAAPDLLEALRGARQTILELVNARYSEAEGSDDDWMAEIDAAIAKAEGRP